MKKTINVFRGTATDYSIRTELLEGDKYYVFPVVMMKEGVHHGSAGPILHKAEELSKIVAAWNGIPVTLTHPRMNNSYVSANIPTILENYAVGRVFNTYFEGNSLHAEVWIEESKISTLSNSALQTLLNQEPMDVSVGTFSEDIAEEGEWNGESYIAVATNYRPDHLALLPNEDGACSWADGCGIRVNLENGSKTITFVQNKTNMKKQRDFTIQTNEDGYRVIGQKLQRLLDSMDSGGIYHYLEELYTDRAVYSVESSGEQSVYFQQGYNVLEDGTVEFTGDPVKVKKEVTYIQTNKKEESKMEKISKERVDALIANTNTRYTENDRSWMEELPATAADSLEPREMVRTNSKPTKEDALQVLNLSKIEDYMDLMPDDMKEQVQKGVELYNEKRTSLIETIQTNTKDVWAEDELKAMSTTMLEKLAKSANTEVDYSANGGSSNPPQVNTKDEVAPLLPLGVNEQKEEK